MKRREFLKNAFVGATAIGGGLGMSLTPRKAWAMPPFPRTLVNIMLNGGADLRYIFVPHPDYDPAYVEQFWAARNRLYTQGYADYPTMYLAEYTSVNSDGFSFGIHNSCHWLIQQFNAGNVAVICNVVGSDNRRHDHSKIIVNTGDPLAKQFDLDREGWGGRLVEAASSEPNVLAVNSSVSVFCKGSNPRNRLDQVIHGKDMRNIALPNIDMANSLSDSKNVTIRALSAYYTERSREIKAEKPGNWPFHHFFQHYDSIRAFGSQIDNRLASFPLPEALANLSSRKSDFALQCRNLYDCCLSADLVNLKVISMSYSGWDTHKNQQTLLNQYLPDILGVDGALDVLSTQLSNDIPGANENLVYLFSSDFGRQLAANGALGTDHGIGSYSVLVGNDVSGGVYGEMFPLYEASPDPDDSQGRTPFEIPGHDIAGLTSIERVNARLCDWAVPGASSQVFPQASISLLESGVNLDTLLAF